MKVNFAKPTATASAPAVAAPVVPTPAAPEVITQTVPTPVDNVAVETVTTAPAIAPVAAPVAVPEAPVAATPAMVIEGNTGAVALVPKTETAVAETKPAFYDDESLDPNDLVLPRFNIVQKVGELSNVFTHGSLLLNGQLVLAEGAKGFAVSSAVRMVVVGFQPTLYTEKVEGGLRGNLFKNEQDVVKAGGTLDWNEAQATKKPLYQRLATAMVLVEQPEGLDPDSFPVEIEGKRYALALYSMKGASYTNGAKIIKSARKIGHLKANGYRGGWWTIASQLKKYGENYAFIPVVKPAGSTTPEFRAALKDLIGF